MRPLKAKNSSTTTEIYQNKTLVLFAVKQKKQHTHTKKQTIFTSLSKSIMAWNK